MVCFRPATEFESFRPLLRIGSELSVELKCAAVADAALQPETPIHQFHQTRGNCETQTGSPEPPRCRTVGLSERFEDLVLMGYIRVRALIAFGNEKRRD